ncbi:hypothetical protein SAMN05444695_101401 [Rhodococcus triatomae]|uniref:Uncharacterized protein n=1 Tax=Rhodococcus triatomae TaxID=300028 RepID=A0A1G8AEK9_9NOCA|nr:DUF6350 family protein [Rhodococcus triatomae]SDH19307.1 hypothetical protein SAMN05444695_101401 [Rhodococcus triatomae]
MSSLIDRAQRRAPGRRGPADPELTRTLLLLAFRPAAVTVALVSVVVVVTLIAAGSDLTGAFGAIAALWLAIHQVPVRIDGVTLGVLPLLPTAILMYSVARGCARVTEPDGGPRAAARIVGAAVAGPLVVTAVALAVAADASAVVPLDGANPLAAFGWVLVLQAVAASAGVALRARPAWEPIVPSWLREAVRPAVRAVLILGAAGALATAVALLFAWQTVGELLGREEHLVDVLGLTLLSVLYLPNMIVGAVSVLVGASASIGTVSVSVFGNIGGDLPPLPLLGAVPAGLSGGFWPVLLVIPALVGVYFGRDCCRRASGQEALAVVLAGAGAAGLVVAGVSVAAGGMLGAIGPVDLHWWLAGLLVFAWLAVVGSFAAIVFTWIRSRRAAGIESAAVEEDTSAAGAQEAPAALPGVPAEEVPVIATPSAGATVSDGEGPDDEEADEEADEGTAGEKPERPSRRRGEVLEAEIVTESPEPALPAPAGVPPADPEAVDAGAVDAEAVDAEVVDVETGDPEIVDTDTAEGTPER